MNDEIKYYMQELVKELDQRITFLEKSFTTIVNILVKKNIKYPEKESIKEQSYE